MAGPNFKRPIAGITPLGLLTITPGTPLKLNTNIGAQSQGSQDSRQTTGRFKQIVLIADPSNTANSLVFLVFGNNPAATSPQCICGAVAPGGQLACPNGALLDSTSINIDNLWLDSNGTGAQKAYAFGIWG